MAVRFPNVITERSAAIFLNTIIALDITTTKNVGILTTLIHNLIFFIFFTNKSTQKLPIIMPPPTIDVLTCDIYKQTINKITLNENVILLINFFRCTSIKARLNNSINAYCDL